jgi:cytoskeletal protein CcmA (bactofilin family)
LDRNEKIDDSIVSLKKARRADKVEPEPYYAATYPYNNVYESESGHALEFDDTKDAERVHVYHRSGSYIEWGPTGDRAERIEKDKFTVVIGNDSVYVKGDVKLYVNGNVTAEIQGDVSATIGGGVTADISGGVNMTVGGDVNATTPNLNLTGDLNVTGTIKATQNIIDGTRSMANDRAIYNSHRHTGVRSGPDTSGTPTSTQ